MSQRLQWNVSIQVTGGPQIVSSRSVEVEAYDSINVTVLGTSSPSGPDTDKEIDVQPGGAGQLKFFIITSDRYSDLLTYKVNANTNPSIKLDQPQVLVGEGAVGLLDPNQTDSTDVVPNKLFLSSTLNEDASIQILVGRDATP